MLAIALFVIAVFQAIALGVDEKLF